MTDYSLSDKFSFDGSWFLPSLEADKVPIAGTLNWGDGSAELALHDSLQPVEGHIFAVQEVAPLPAIHGITSGSQLVSLLHAYAGGTQFSFGAGGGKQVQTLHSNWCVIGAHVDPSTLYSKIRFRIPGLQLWLGHNTAKMTAVKLPEAKFIYEFDELTEEQIEISANDLTLGFSTDRNFPSPHGIEMTIKWNGYLSLVPSEPQTFEWIIKELKKATTLLSFLTGAPMLPDLIQAKTEHGQRANILAVIQGHGHCTFTNHHDYFILRNNMGVSIDETFKKWYADYEKFETTCQLALSILCSSHLWVHVEFLSLMQALEGLHRALMPGLYTTEEEFEKIKDALCGAIPSGVDTDHKSSLKNRIKYANEFSLRKRLKHLVELLPEHIREAILGESYIPGAWVDTRNYYTHWDKNSATNVLSDQRMYSASSRMKMLLRVLYLNIVGVTENSLIKALDGTHRESQYIMSLNALIHRQRNPGSAAGSIGQVSMTSLPVSQSLAVNTVPDENQSTAHCNKPKPE